MNSEITSASAQNDDIKCAVPDEFDLQLMAEAEEVNDSVIVPLEKLKEGL